MDIKTDLLKEQLQNAENQLNQALVLLGRCEGAVAVLKHLIEQSQKPVEELVVKEPE